MAALTAGRKNIMPADPTDEQDFRKEAERLAKLPGRERKAVLAVHWRIADDASLSQVTRDHARHVAETLERLLKPLLKRKAE
jgi:hypothetical protein